MPSQAATSAWLTPSLPAMLSMTAACCRVIGNPICRARRSNRRLISRETSCTRKPKARPTSVWLRSGLPSCIRSRSIAVRNTSLGGMTTLRKSRSARVRECLLRARRAIWTTDPAGKPFEIEVDDGCGVKRQPLRDEQPADNCDTQRAAELRPGSLAEGDRHSAEQGCKGRHHNRSEPQQAGLVDCLSRALAFH